MRDRAGRGCELSDERGQAAVELALVLPLLLLLAFGVVAVGRVVQAQSAVSGVAKEAARSAATANNATEAYTWGMSRGNDVALGFGLTNGTLQLAVAPGSFSRGGVVESSARYQVALDDLPLLGWARLTVASSHRERTDPYRSRWPAGGG